VYICIYDIHLCRTTTVECILYGKAAALEYICIEKSRQEVDLHGVYVVNYCHKAARHQCSTSVRECVCWKASPVTGEKSERRNESVREGGRELKARVRRWIGVGSAGVGFSERMRSSRAYHRQPPRRLCGDFANAGRLRVRVFLWSTIAAARTTCRRSIGGRLDDGARCWTANRSGTATAGAVETVASSACDLRRRAGKNREINNSVAERKRSISIDPSSQHFPEGNLKCTADLDRRFVRFSFVSLCCTFVPSDNNNGKNGIRQTNSEGSPGCVIYIGRSIEITINRICHSHTLLNLIPLLL